MAGNLTQTRNLRDDEITLMDGGSETLVLLLDEGDLSWGESEATVEVLDRGILDHTRPGDEEAIDLSYSVKWMSLISKTVTGSGDGSAFYEFINNTDGSTYTSISPAGEKFQLKHRFVITDPASGALTSEQIDFGKVFKQSMNMSEGDDWNTISFSGRDFETRPTITRV